MNSARIEEALSTTGLTARELYALWEQGQPAGDAKKSKAAGVLWIGEDLDLARLFAERALALEEYLLVCDVANEAAQHWETPDPARRTALVKLRLHYADALTRLGRTRDARAQLDECVQDGFQPALGRGLKLDLLLKIGDILREESHHAAAREMRLQTAQEALGFYERALALAKPDDLRPLVYCAEDDIRVFAEAEGFPILPCDLCGSQDNLQRKVVGRMLDDLERARPGTKQIMLAALQNVRPSHLLDRDLWREMGLTVAREEKASEVIPLSRLSR
jgi:hypothetical protein